MKQILFYVLTFVVLNVEALKTVHDDDLMNLIRTKTYVVAFFSSSSKNCPLCDNFESVLTNSEQELAKTLEGPVVKVVNSQLTRLYSPTKEPLLVFFRHGIPLLYNDVPSEELIFHTFLNNKEPIVKELNDQTFEHLTQAATGATTGDWFVMFYSNDCIDCQRLTARWETVGSKLKSRMNIARVNKGSGGTATASRFGVNDVPSFILFRLGKLYRYKIQKYDIESFVAFAQDWYKNMTPERVPHPKTPFDELVDKVVTGLQESTLVLQISGAILVTVLLAVLYSKCKQPAKVEKKKKPAKKEDKDK